MKGIIAGLCILAMGASVASCGSQSRPLARAAQQASITVVSNESGQPTVYRVEDTEKKVLCYYTSTHHILSCLQN